MPESELITLTRLIEELNESTGELAARSAEQSEVQVELRKELSAVRERQTELVPKRGFRWVIVGLVLAGLLVASFVGQNRRTVERFEREAVATDRAFCTVVNYITQEGVNRNQAAIRSLEAGVRGAFQLVPSSDFRRSILAELDKVQIGSPSPPLDCSGIGDGEVNFSLQDAIRNLTTTTTRP